MKTLYFDCFAGASGNMILGALVALGVDAEELTKRIKLLNIADFEIEFTKVDRSGISSVYADVKTVEKKAHRHLKDIEKIISESHLSDIIKSQATKIFQNLALAEATVHGIEIEKIHFHEVGAIDAIVDVVGACVGFEILEVEKFACSKIHVGSGFVQMAHGKFPVPPPAVVELLKNVPIYSTEIEGELITPTGAAIVSTLCNSFGQIPEIKIEKTGYGAGTRTYENFPNVLRIHLGECLNASDNANWVSVIGNQELGNDEPSFVKKKESEIDSGKNTDLIIERLILLETNIDDTSPQILGFVMERAFDIGALDCWFTAIQMKKNRPATLASILCEKEKQEILTELLFTETTTLGVRVTKIERRGLPREIVKVGTEFGEIDVKIARYANEIINAEPEFEMMRKAASVANVSLKKIRDAVKIKIDESDS